MIEFEFFSPGDGGFYANPELSWLESLILHEGEDFWNGGAGQGSLKRDEDGTRVQLLLTLVPPFNGFYLDYIDGNGDYHVPLGEGTFEETATVYICGDPVPLPKALVVSRELAVAAMDEFYNSGRRCEELHWKGGNEVGWHYGYPEE